MTRPISFVQLRSRPSTRTSTSGVMVEDAAQRRHHALLVAAAHIDDIEPPRADQRALAWVHRADTEQEEVLRIEQGQRPRSQLA